MSKSENTYRELEKPFQDFCADVLGVERSALRIGRYRFDGLLKGHPFRTFFLDEDGLNELNFEALLCEMAAETAQHAPAVREITVAVPWQLPRVYCSALWASEVRVNIRYVMPWTLVELYRGATFETLSREFREEEEYLRTLPIGYTRDLWYRWMRDHGMCPDDHDFSADPNVTPFTLPDFSEADAAETVRFVRVLRAEYGITGRPFRSGAGEGVTFIGRLGETPVKLGCCLTFIPETLTEIAFRLQADPRNEVKHLIVMAEEPLDELEMEAVEFNGIRIDIHRVPLSFSALESEIGDVEG